MAGGIRGPCFGNRPNPAKIKPKHFSQFIPIKTPFVAENEGFTAFFSKRNPHLDASFPAKPVHIRPT